MYCCCVVVCLFFCPSVRVCVIVSCEQDVSKSYEQILMKFFGRVGRGSATS